MANIYSMFQFLIGRLNPPKDAYDAMELGVFQFLIGRLNPSAMVLAALVEAGSFNSS